MHLSKWLNELTLVLCILYLNFCQTYYIEDAGHKWVNRVTRHTNADMSSSNS